MKINIKLLPEPEKALDTLADIATALFIHVDLQHMPKGKQREEVFNTCIVLRKVANALKEAIKGRDLQ